MKMELTNHMRVRLTFTDEVLATQPADKEIHSHYISSKAPDAKAKEEEIEAIGVEEFIERGMTVFPRDKKGRPIIYGYQAKGFFKAAAKTLKDVKDTYTSKMTAYLKRIDRDVFIFPSIEDRAGRMIPFHDYGEIHDCQRPLRASTPQGERVAISHSEAISAGAWIEFDIEWFEDKQLSEAVICEWLDYGVYSGLLQWRNAGKGTFTWERVTEQ